MTLPREIIPGRFYMVTRRCTQRQLLLRPDKKTNNAFIYCLAEAAQRFGIDVLCVPRLGKSLFPNARRRAVSAFRLRP
jgi:hypothetical protein